MILYSVHYSRYTTASSLILLHSNAQKGKSLFILAKKKTGSFMYETIDLLNYNGKNASHNVIH